MSTHAATSSDLIADRYADARRSPADVETRQRVDSEWESRSRGICRLDPRAQRRRVRFVKRNHAISPSARDSSTGSRNEQDPNDTRDAFASGCRGRSWYTAPSHDHEFSGPCNAVGPPFIENDA